jgi:hypothetical protein
MRRGRGGGGVGDVGQLDEVLVEPLAVGLLGGDLLLDFLVGDDAATLAGSIGRTPASEPMMT